MENDKYYFRVGFFLFVVITFAFLLFSWIEKDKNGKNYIPYAIYFNDAVTGLTLGSPVRLKGIDVGIVKEIDFHSYDDDRIRVIVNITNTAPIRTNTTASLRTQGITGVSYIFLENIKSDIEPGYIKKEPGDKYLVIQSQPSGLQQLFTGLPIMIKKFTAVGNSVKDLLKSSNVKEAEEILKNVNELIDKLEKVATEAELTLVESRIMMKEIRLLTKEIRLDPSLIFRAPKYKGIKLK